MNAARTLLRGLAALAVLAVLTLGVPWLLLRISGSPIPDTIPTWNQISTALTSRDDGTLLLGLLNYAAWAGWALFAASLIADLVARARGISVPQLGPQQHLASGLVSAVVAIAVTIPSASAAAVAAPAQGPTQTISTTTARDAPHAAQGDSWRVALASAPARAARPTSVRTDRAARFTHYTVGKGDCLWDIAWNELGDPERWPELWDASRHLRQPGGHRITDPDHIEPGWTILIPAPRSATAFSSKPAHSEPSAAAPLVTTPLDLPAGVPGRTSGARPAVVTPLNLPAAGIPSDQVHPAQARALDRWAAAVSRHDSQATQREAWRSRIGDLDIG